MIVAIAVVIGILFGSASYLMLRRSMVKLLLGIVLLGHGVSLLLFQIGCTNPLSASFSSSPPAPESFPHMLVGIGMLFSFMMVLLLLALIYRVNWDVGSDDLDDVTFRKNA